MTKDEILAISRDEIKSQVTTLEDHIRRYKTGEIKAFELCQQLQNGFNGITRELICIGENSL